MVGNTISNMSPHLTKATLHFQLIGGTSTKLLIGSFSTNWYSPIQNPIVNPIGVKNHGSELLPKHTVDAFDNSVGGCGWLALDTVAIQPYEVKGNCMAKLC